VSVGPLFGTRQRNPVSIPISRVRTPRSRTKIIYFLGLF
jgi:hypothetical protein